MTTKHEAPTPPRLSFPTSEAVLSADRESGIKNVQALPAFFTGSPLSNLPALKLWQGAGMTQNFLKPQNELYKTGFLKK